MQEKNIKNCILTTNMIDSKYLTKEEVTEINILLDKVFRRLNNNGV